MAGSLLLSHTRTWLGHNITHISFRWRHFSVSTWGESRLLVIHYRLVSENLFIAMVRRMENCTQSCLKAIASWVQFPLKLISFVTKAAPELERVRDVCWWKKKHHKFLFVPKQSICFHESKVFLMYCAQTKYFMCTVPKQSIPAWRQIDSASLCVCGSQTLLLQKGIIWLELKLTQVLLTIGQILSTKIFIYNVASCNVFANPKNNKYYWLNW